MTDIEDPNPAEEAWLFDGAEAPDEASQRLERLLRLQRVREDPAQVAALAARVGAQAARRGRSGRQLRLAAAALLVVALGGLWWTLGGARASRPTYRVHDAQGVRVVGVGGRVEAADEGTRIQVARLGDVSLESGSSLRVLEPEPGAHRFFLERGALRAVITAAPRAFQVDTSAGSSVDLGCVYRLELDAEGRTRLAVEFGRVAFEDAASGRNVYVPAGASCVATPGRGPASPSFDSALPGWRAALAQLDFAEQPGDALLAAVRESGDSLGLWHLLGASSAEVRAAAFERLAQLVPPPEGVSRADIVASADGSSGSPSHAARRAWLEGGDFFWYSFDWE